MVTEKVSPHPSLHRDPSKVPVVLPCDLETWPLVQGALTRLKRVSNVSEAIPIMDHIYALIHGGAKSADTRRTRAATVLAGLVNFLEVIATREERILFFDQTLPMIVDLALALGELKPKEGFFYSVQQIGGETRLPRRFVASLISHLFLSTLPKPLSLSLNLTHFAIFFSEVNMSNEENSQTAKLRCILNYFNRLATNFSASGPPGSITFTRKVLARDEMPMLETWKDSRLQLCPLVVRPDGSIEEAGSSSLQVDFANEYIGGGVLESGCVQEEIRFSICPELLVSLIFMESMEENEAISIGGFEQFSSYSGYGWGLKYAGDFRDSAQITNSGDIKTSLVAIDASCNPGDDQYKDTLLLRDLNKAYVGFLQNELSMISQMGGELNSESIYLDAMDQSQMSTEGDFETASEGLDSHPRSVTPCISTISDYSNSLSRAITDIAVKDYCQGKRDQATQSEPSIDLEITGKGDGRIGCRHDGLNNFASSIAGNVVREGYVHASRRSTSERVEGDHGQAVEGIAEDISNTLITDAINSHLGDGQSHDRVIWKNGHGGPHGDGDGITQNLGAIIDDIVGVVIKEALAEIAGMCVSETSSTRGPSLEGYSVISTWSSSKSDSFVRIDMDSEFSASGTRSVGSLSSVGSERVGMTVETYVSNVVAGAMQKMKNGDVSEEQQRTQNAEPIDSGYDINATAERIVGGVMEEAKKKLQRDDENGLRNSYFKPVVSAGLDAFATSITDFAFKDALKEMTASVPDQRFQYSQYSTIPSTPPPSPSNASTGSSKRFSLEDPTQLEEFAEKLLSSITPESASPRQQGTRASDGYSRFQEIESFANSLVSKAVTDSTQIVSSCGQFRRESSSGCISSRSSLTVPSGSSKRSSMDSFTEDLLRIGNIDPTGRRPSKTEENIAFFSQELTRVAEVEEKLGQRRKSDLEDFQHELCQTSISSSASQKNEVTQSKIHAASRLANRLSDDIICDAFLQLYGATPFRELIRLDSLSDLDSGGGNRRRSYPRRGFRTSSVSSASLSVRSTISEMDLVTLATNLANSIVESALQTYRDEYLTAQRLAAESTTEDVDSQIQDTMDEVSILATYDGSNLDRQETACTSLAGELPPVLSIQETAGCIVEKAVQDAVLLYQASLSSTTGVSRHPVGTPARRPIATGNWGCGVFGGDPQLKSLLQWVAASQCRAPSLFYYSFNDKRVQQLEQVTLKIQTKRWSVGDLMRIVLEYCHHVTTSGEESGKLGLFDYILGLQC
nr:uncharacterized protein LOC129279206 [Lytechinus pictus]